jgi:hypothetical protein
MTIGKGPGKEINKMLNIIERLRIKIMQIDSDTSKLNWLINEL